MSELIRKTISELQRHLTELDAEVLDTKRTINSLCKRVGDAPLYGDADRAGTAAPLRGDEFYARPLATAVREILEARRHANLGPATVAEIFEKLTEGGYLFDTQNADNAKRSLRISLAKNAVFHKLPSAKWGLATWYQLKEPKHATTNGKGADPAEEAEPEEGEAIGTEELIRVATRVSADEDLKFDLLAAEGKNKPSKPK